MPFIVGIGSRSEVVAGIEGRGSLGVHIVEYPGCAKPTTIRVQAFRNVAPHETESIDWCETEISTGETITVQYVADAAPSPPIRSKSSRDDERICVHDRETAAAIRDLAHKFNEQMIEFIPRVQAQASEDDLKKFKRAVGRIVYEVHENMLAPIYARYPDLGAPEENLEE